MKKPIIYYLWGSGMILVISLLFFGVGLVIWSSFFGVPCWAFDGGEMNNTITREVIERCKR